MAKMVNDVIWAKLRYCSWWPARIVVSPPAELADKITSKQVCVFFFGKKQYGIVDVSNVCGFSENRSKYENKNRKKSFTEAIRHCDEYLSNPEENLSNATIDPASNVIVRAGLGDFQIKQEPEDEDGFGTFNKLEYPKNDQVEEKPKDNDATIANSLQVHQSESGTDFCTLFYEKSQECEQLKADISRLNGRAEPDQQNELLKEMKETIQNLTNQSKSNFESIQAQLQDISRKKVEDESRSKLEGVLIQLKEQQQLCDEHKNARQAAEDKVINLENKLKQLEDEKSVLPVQIESQASQTDDIEGINGIDERLKEKDELIVNLRKIKNKAKKRANNIGAEFEDFKSCVEDEKRELEAERNRWRRTSAKLKKQLQERKRLHAESLNAHKGSKRFRRA